MNHRTIPILSPATLTRVRQALAPHPIAAAYLFGSQATGTAGPMSDVDVGILTEPGLDSDARFALRLELMSTLADAFAVTEVDVVILNDPAVSTLLRFNAIQPGQVIDDRNQVTRKQFEFETLRDYYDQHYYQTVYGETVRQTLRDKATQ